MRRLVILSTWLACGRASECAFLSWEGLCWDPFFRCVFIEVPQSKTSKVKVVPFMAGKNRYVDWYLQFADFLAVGPKDVYDDGSPFIFPNLAALKQPGSAVGNYIKALQRGGAGALQKYASVALDCLPKEPCAAGIRHGCCNSMAALMPCEFAAAISDHELSSLGALWEYLEASLAASQPGATVLSGFPAPPWGHMCKGPAAASLQPLVQAGVPSDVLDNFMDNVLRIDSSRPPHLMPGGELREFARAAAAHLIMYYRERSTHKEVPGVLLSMQKHALTALQEIASRRSGSASAAAAGGGAGGAGGAYLDPHASLLQWSQIIQDSWQADNGLRHRACVCTSAPSGSTGTSFSSFSPSSSPSAASSGVSRPPLMAIHTCPTAASSEADALILGSLALGRNATTALGTTMTSGLDDITAQLAQLTAMVSQLQAQQRSSSGGGAGAPVGGFGESSMSGNAAAAAASSSASAPPPPRATVAAPPPKVNAFQAIMLGGATPAAPITFKYATEVFLYMCEHGGSPTTAAPSDKTRYSRIFDIFWAMATDSERLILRPPSSASRSPSGALASAGSAASAAASSPSPPTRDPGAIARTANSLHILVVARFVEEFKNREIAVPQNLSKGVPFAPSTIETRETELGRKLDPPSFAAWRAKREEEEQRAAALDAEDERARKDREKRQKGGGGGGWSLGLF